MDCGGREAVDVCSFRAVRLNVQILPVYTYAACQCPGFELNRLQIVPHLPACFLLKDSDTNVRR